MTKINKKIKSLNNIELLDEFIKSEGDISYDIREMGIMNDNLFDYNERLKKEILRRMNNEY